MLELNATNAADYLRERSWISAESVDVTELSGGVSNLVLRVSTPEGRFVLKQSRPQLRTREDWFSDLNRIWREQEVMQALEPLLPGVVPHVLHVDRDNYVYTMSHAPIDATVWKSDLLAGRIDVGMGAKVGDILGRIHQSAAAQASRFDAFRDHTAYVQLRIDPFYRRVLERRPEVASIIASIIADMLTIKESLCHGDYTPKNMLVHDGTFTLVDYETAHFGDPTMDLGLCLTHLTLKAIRSSEHRLALFDLIAAFWQGYRAVVTFCAQADLERRGMRHLGACLLARVDGTSPMDYLDPAQRDAVRSLGRTILLDGVARWADVPDLIARLPRPSAPE